MKYTPDQVERAREALAHARAVWTATEEQDRYQQWLERRRWWSLEEEDSARQEWLLQDARLGYRRELAVEAQRARVEQAKAEALRQITARRLNGMRLAAEQEADRRRGRVAARELARQQALYRRECQRIALETGPPRPPKPSRPGLAYLLIAERQHQENLIRIVGARFNRLLAETLPEDGASLPDEDSAWGSESFWDAYWRLLRWHRKDGLEDKRLHNRGNNHYLSWSRRRGAA